MDYADLKIFACWGKDLDEQENLQNKSLFGKIRASFSSFSYKIFAQRDKAFYNVCSPKSHF